MKAMLAFGIMLSAGIAAAQWLPSHETDAGVHPVSELIFQPGSAPFAQCHASTIVALRDGGLMAAWFGGTREGAPDVAIWSSRFEHGVWSAPKELARESKDGKGVATWNPVLFHTDDGRLWLYYKYGENTTVWKVMRMSSTDEGLTWSSKERLPDGILGPVRTKPLVLPHGLIVSGSSTEGKDGWRVFIERSTNDGQAWSSIGPITMSREQDADETPWPEPPMDSPELRAKDRGPRIYDGIIQPSVVRFSDGRLRFYARSKTLAARIVVSDSTDEGKTWTPTRFLNMPSNNSGLDAIALKDGRVVMIFNDTPRGRSPLNLAVSRDGEHFRVFATLEQGEGEFSYPALVQDLHGDLEMTYTWKRISIKHAYLPLPEVPQR